MPEKAKPVQQIRLGPIKAAIWKNTTESGAQFNVTFERLFKKDDEWQSFNSMPSNSSSQPEPSDRPAAVMPVPDRQNSTKQM